MNTEVSHYINNSPEEQKSIMEKIREMIHQEVPNVQESMKWGRPIFSASSDFAYFKTSKSHLTFGFFKSDKISSDSQFLEGTGKDMKHVKFKKMEDVDLGRLRRWMNELTA
jgi:uncharacterized protein YdhG (YjbR/CyaY superfamily)